MKHLFIDTSEYAVIGIYDDSSSDQESWLAYEPLLEKQSSSIIHQKIYDLLALHKMEINAIDSLIIVSGPGSYTGLRVSEGIAQIVGWHNIPILSFYHFDLPKMLGVTNGCFYSYAFKNEYFLFTWNESSSTRTLVSKDSLLTKLSYENIFTHYQDNEMKGIKQVCETSALLFKNPSLLKKVFDLRVKCPPFYYRALEEEFKQTC